MQPYVADGMSALQQRQNQVGTACHRVMKVEDCDDEVNGGLKVLDSGGLRVQPCTYIASDLGVLDVHIACGVRRPVWISLSANLYESDRQPRLFDLRLARYSEDIAFLNPFLTNVGINL